MVVALDGVNWLTDRARFRRILAATGRCDEWSVECDRDLFRRCLRECRRWRSLDRFGEGSNRQGHLAMSSQCWNHPGEFDGIRIAAKRDQCAADDVDRRGWGRGLAVRSEAHTSELQSLMRISYAVFCLKKKKQKNRS